MNERHFPQRRAGLHRLFLAGMALSVVLYVVSLFLPAIGFGDPGTKNVRSGAWLLFCGVFSLNQTPAWLANVAYGLGLVFGVIEIATRQAPTQTWKRVLRFIALALFVAAALLGLTTLRHLDVPIAIAFNSGEGVVRRLVQPGPGFYCWIGSFVVAAVVMLFALFERVVQHQQTKKPEGDVLEEH